MARISEMHYSNAYAKKSGVSEFLEVSLDPSEDPANYTVSFYNHDGTTTMEVDLDHDDVRVSYDPDSGENVYVISQEDFGILLTDPDGGGTYNSEAFALTNTSTDEVIDFYDIGGGTKNIEALEGAASGAVSTNIPLPTSANASTYSIQFNQPDPTTPVFMAVNAGDSGVCFTPGTMIDMEFGARAVEDLVPGDRIWTRDAGIQTLRWVSARTVPAAGILAPVRIAAGMFGLTAPLLVSPQHRMLLTGWQAELLTGRDEVLVAARHLVDGDRVLRWPGGMVRYIHLLFDTHQLVCANGAWSESFHPGQQALDTLDPAARAELSTLFPGLVADADSYGQSARMTLRAHEAQLLRQGGMV